MPARWTFRHSRTLPAGGGVQFITRSDDGYSVMPAACAEMQRRNRIPALDAADPLARHAAFLLQRIAAQACRLALLLQRARQTCGKGKSRAAPAYGTTGARSQRKPRLLPLSLPLGRVQLQQPHRGPPDGGVPDDPLALPSEVLRPLVTARVKKPDQRALLRHRCDVAALRAIARHAREREILRFRLPAMLFADDVIHLAAKPSVRLGDPAVFATFVRACPDETPQFRRNVSLTHCPPGDAHAPSRAA